MIFAQAAAWHPDILAHGLDIRTAAWCVHRYGAERLGSRRPALKASSGWWLDPVIPCHPFHSNPCDPKMARCRKPTLARQIRPDLRIGLFSSRLKRYTFGLHHRLVAVHPGASRLQAATKRFHLPEGGNAPVRSSFDLTSTAATGAHILSTVPRRPNT